jgi:outer membrane protein assembly factor BamA
VAPDEPSRYSWVRYGATVGGFVDLTGQQRVVGLQLIADFAEPLQQNGRIPFTELVDLGGDRPMRGYLEGRLRGRSAVVAQVEYQWPIWVWLDGKMEYDIGNVFGTQLEGFELRRLRQSFGVGLAANNARDHAFEILIGTGTRTFEEGSELEHLRFVVGASSGF